MSPRTAIMIDIEGLDVNPTATILTIGAQLFDPFAEGVYDGPGATLYARITTESQPNRTIDEGTLAWWSQQSAEAKEEAFGEGGRIDIRDALIPLAAMVRKSSMVFANGTTYDITILEHAYKELGMSQPWKYNTVRDARTIYSLYPGLKMPPTSHNALDDCFRQIALLQATLQHLGIKEMRA